jgi:cytochrome c-type biogenesis protein CcmH
LLLLAGGSSRAAAAPGAPPEVDVASLPAMPGERALEGRLLAPCCWAQTLDVHESGLSRELRLEIRRRLHAGERVEAIEQDLVARYGERLRATPRADVLREVSALVMLALGLAGVVALLGVRRWQARASKEGAPAMAAVEQARDAEDERLDAELDALD